MLPKGRVWRKRSEGLTQGCLAKGSKSGMGGKVAKFMVAISHCKGVLVWERYDKMDRNYFVFLLTSIATQFFHDHAKDLAARQ